MMLAELLQNRFRADLRHRGAVYIEAERVAIVRVTADNIFGVVRDGTEYQTQLRRDERDVALFCTCGPFAKSGACKHLWATVLASDSAGHISPATRPGSLPPFISPSMIGTITDSLTDPMDTDDLTGTVPASRRRARVVPEAPPVRLRPWEAKLLQLRDEMQGTNHAGAKDAGRDREIVYELDIEGSIEANRLVVQASQRQRRSNGQWGKIKPLKIRPGQLDQIEHEDDRTFLSYLSGAVPERNQWSSQQAELQASAHRFHVPYELGVLIFPAMCASGRFRVLDDGDDSTLLEWDEGPPWELTISVVRSGESDGWVLKGRVVRDEETLELSETQLVVPGGFVVNAGAISRLNDFGAPEWIPVLAEQEIRFPVDDQQDFVDSVLDIPTLPRLELPRELRLEEVRVQPTPALKLVAPPASRWNNDLLAGEVGFNYMGETVPGSSSRWAIVQRDQKRCLIRDTAFEASCWNRLRDAGFRRRLTTGVSAKDVDIPRRELGRAVRELIADGWNVYADGSRVRQAGEMRFRVQSDIDWFDVTTEVDFEGRSVAFPELLRALERGDSTVRLDDGSLGILPEKWLEQMGLIAGMGRQEEGGLRFSNSQAALLDALLAGQEHVELDDRFQDLREKFRTTSGIDAIDPPESFVGELRDYQRDGLSWMKFLNDLGFGGCLADDMGLGKTIQFLAALSLRKQTEPDCPPSLVVVPRSLMFNWYNECGKFTPDLKVMEYTGLQRAALRPEFPDVDVILTTYGTVRRDIASLREFEFDYVVLDEAQTIKNPSSQIARASRLLRCRHRMALSGTPIENNAGDLWSIFEFLNPGLLGRSSAFRAHVADPDNDEIRKVVSAGLRPFILRRTKQQVAAELPERLEETVLCRMEDDQKALYDELRLHYRDSLLGMVAEQGLDRARMHVLEALLRLRQAACHPALLNRGSAMDPCAKLDFLLPHLDELIAEGHKALIFSQFTSMLSIVREHLDRRHVTYEYLDGKTRDREAHVQRFQDDEECPLFLISLKAGGLGLNLTAADYVFLLDPWWNPAVEAQAIDRAHRVGQTRTVFAYRMICKDTVEEKIAELQSQKRELADALLEGDQNSSILKDLSTDDLELLLS